MILPGVILIQTHLLGGLLIGRNCNRRDLLSEVFFLSEELYYSVFTFYFSLAKHEIGQLSVVFTFKLTSGQS